VTTSRCNSIVQTTKHLSRKKASQLAMGLVSLHSHSTATKNKPPQLEAAYIAPVPEQLGAGSHVAGKQLQHRNSNSSNRKGLVQLDYEMHQLNQSPTVGATQA
jgi:hypothetical protein